MKTNLRMRALLERLDLNPLDIWKDGKEEQLVLERVDGCVFLAKEYARSHGATLDRFLNRTGLECFVNHVHFQAGPRRALEEVFSYISALRSSLTSLGDGEFEIIMSVDDGKSTVRFHKWRPGESWLTEDLEGYKSEAMLSATVPSSSTS